MPLDLGPRLARAARAQAEYEEALALARATDAQTQLEVTTAHIELNEARKRSDILLGAEDLGLAETREVTDALKAHFQTRVRYLQAVHDFNVATAMMVRATGLTPSAKD